MPEKTQQRARKHCLILNIKVDSTELVEVLSRVQGWIKEKRRFFIVTPNPEIVMLAQKDPVLSSILNSADLSLPDGVGLVWVSKWRALPQGRQSPITCRVSGIDTMEALVELASRRGWRVFLLGGKPGIAQQAAKKITNHYSLITIHYASDPLLNADGKPINKTEIEKEKRIIEKINEFRPHLLFVGFGAPKQEKWVALNYNKLETLGTMVVGGAFDYLSGRLPRAPKWLQNLGLEWLFRLLVEPWRIRRQLILLKFAWTVLRK